MGPAGRALLSHILDYAGLFPPAQLPLHEALGNYLRYQQSPESWLLGRFLCPAGRLVELVPLREELTSLSLSVVGRGGQDAKELFDNVRADLADIKTLRQKLGLFASAEFYEVRLPAALLQSPRATQLSALVGTIAFLIETSGLALTPFVECPVLEPTTVQALVHVLLADRQSPEGRQRQICGPVGWKLRCGGADAAAIPTPQQLTLVLAACCAAGIPWKATAGLHHPFRHFDAQLQTARPGFVNVFGAGILAHAGQLNEVQMEEMLKDEDPTHFRLSDDAFQWTDFRAGTAHIEAARQHLVTSFGSCSFDDPCADLCQLGWL